MTTAAPATRSVRATPQLETKPLRIGAPAGPSGRLFGALTQGDVAQAAADQGLRIDKRRVEFATPIKSVGDHEATVACTRR